MQLEGWKVTVVPESLVWHVGGGTLPATSPFKLFLNYRNNLFMLEKNLARTYALRYFKKGMKPERAASKALKKASHKIFFRMCLDGMSALVYLVTGQKECFKAVWKAHGEFTEMHAGPTRNDITGYLKTYGEKASVTGIYGKWIVLSSLLKKEKVFGSIREKDFIK
jgi:hypothetical protein